MDTKSCSVFCVYCMCDNVLRLWPDASESAAKRSELTLANSFKALGSSPSESVALLEHDGRCRGRGGVGVSQGVLLNCLDEGGVYAAAAAAAEYRPLGRVTAFSNEPRPFRKERTALYAASSRPTARVGGL